MSVWRRWCTWAGALGLGSALVSAVMFAVLSAGAFLCAGCDVDTLEAQLTLRARISDLKDALWLMSLPLSLLGVLWGEHRRWGKLGFAAAALVLLMALLR